MKLARNIWFPYVLVSLIAIVWNIFTLHNFLPWCDEVMLTDAPAHKLLYGEWKTNAFNGIGNAEPYANGLYMWVLFIWLKIFGLSFLSVRFFSLITTLCVGGFALNILRKFSDEKLTLYASWIFSIGFWFSSMIVLDYRMARYDMLGCLFVFLLVNVVIKCLKEDKIEYFKILTISSLVVMAGIQVALYSVLITLFAILFVRPIRKMIRIGLIIALGNVLGFIILCCIHWYNGHLAGYIFEIINASGTLQKLWGIAREYLLPLLGHEVKPLPVQNVNSMSFIDNIIRFFDNSSTIILVSVALLLCAINNPLKKIKEKQAPILLVLFSIFVVVFFILAGRYPVYYRWTAVIPLIGAYSLWCDQGRALINRVLVSGACIAFFCLSLIEMGDPTDDTLDRIEAFIERQNFKQGDRIATVFSTYYAVKPQSVNSYWYEIYPIDRIGQIDYLILPEYNKDKNNFFYHDKEIIDTYYNMILNDTLHVMEKIDSMSEPHLMLYAIKRK